MKNNDDLKLLFLLDDKYLPKWYKAKNNPKNKLLFKDYLEYWLNVYHKGEIKYNTYLSYKNSINNYISPYLGNIILKELSPKNINDFYLYLKRIKTSQATVICIHRCLSKSLNDAVFLMYIVINPLDYVDKISNTPKSINYLSIKEIRIMEKQLYKNRDSIYFLPTYLGLSLGLRRGEILGLKYNDIDIINKIIHIERSYLIHGKKYYLSTPKTKNSKRNITISDNVIKEIYYKKEKYKCNDNDFICTNPSTNKIINYYPWRKFLTNVCDEAKISKIRIHDLRHANATKMLADGVSMKEASMRLGHSTINTTMDIYSHIDKDVDKLTSLTIEKILL